MKGCSKCTTKSILFRMGRLRFILGAHPKINFNLSRSDSNGPRHTREFYYGDRSYTIYIYTHINLNDYTSVFEISILWYSLFGHGTFLLPLVTFPALSFQHYIRYLFAFQRVHHIHLRDCVKQHTVTVTKFNDLMYSRLLQK